MRSPPPSQLGVSELGSRGDFHGAPKLDLGCPAEEGCKQGVLCFPFCPTPTSWQSWGHEEGREGKPLGLIQEEFSQRRWSPLPRCREDTILWQVPLQ